MSSFLTDPNYEQSRSFLLPNYKPKPSPRWCTCARSGGGYRHAGDDLWVHVTCGKPTRMFLEAYENKRGKR